MAKLSQNDKIMMWLKTNRAINPAQAFTELGIYRLSARIKELREKGYDIRTLMTETKNGETKYATYVYVDLPNGGESNNG